MSLPVVYLAGPAVFRPDAKEVGAELVALCAEYGLDGRFPLDSAFTTAEAIFAGNVKMIRDADAVIADLSPFRGPHCDVGTAFEVGFAHAIGLPVFAYSDDVSPLVRRIPTFIAGARPRDAEDLEIENFDLIDNLMVAQAVRQPVHRSADDAIAAAAAALLPR